MKQNTKTTTATTTDRKTSFASLLTAYGNAYANRDSDPTAYADTLTDLATAVAYSVLKKCIDTSYNSTLVTIRAELGRDTHNADRLTYASDHAYTTAHNEDGDAYRKTVDPACAQALTELTRLTLGDGIDLVHDAIVSIMEETERQTANGETVDLERPYTVRRLKRKVWIKSADSVNGWENVETSPIREIYKAVRRAINTSRAAATDPRNGYSYIEDIATDPETGETTDIYRRLTKYADLGGYATDFNGACTFYSVTPSDVDESDRLLASLNLTKKQAQVLNLKQSGHGNKAIATYLGVTENSVKGAMNEIKRKAKKGGYDPVMKSLSEKLNNELARLYKAVDRLMDETPTAYRTYADINADIDRMNARIEEINATLDAMEA